MVSSINVTTLSNSTFSGWPPSEASCTFFGCFVVLKFSEVVLDPSSVLPTVLLLLCFCYFNSSISVFNGAISLNGFCWFVFYAFLVGDVDLLLECFEVKDWSFCCSVGLSPVEFVFLLIKLDTIFVCSLKCLHMLASGCLVSLWFVLYYCAMYIYNYLFHYKCV